MEFLINESNMIPVEAGQAVRKGWTNTPFGKPVGVTMHWAVTRTLDICTKVIGGDKAARKSQASAHYCVGRSFDEGTERYVSLDDRSYHCQAGQTLRWDGQKMTSTKFSGIHTTIGIETVHMGFADQAEVSSGVGQGAG